MRILSSKVLNILTWKEKNYGENERVAKPLNRSEAKGDIFASFYI